MTNTIAVSGIVATQPNRISGPEGLKITSFRLASTQRRFDRQRDRWIDGETNWFTVTAFRQLASNIETSVIKGDKVVVTGRLRIRDWDNGEKKGINVDIEADAVGHDLAWGTTTFIRASSSTNAALADEPPVSEPYERSEHDGPAPYFSIARDGEGDGGAEGGGGGEGDEGDEGGDGETDAETDSFGQSPIVEVAAKAPF